MAPETCRQIRNVTKLPESACRVGSARRGFLVPLLEASRKAERCQRPSSRGEGGVGEPGKLPNYRSKPDRNPCRRSASRSHRTRRVEVVFRKANRRNTPTVSGAPRAPLSRLDTSPLLCRVRATRLIPRPRSASSQPGTRRMRRGLGRRHPAAPSPGSTIASRSCTALASQPSLIAYRSMSPGSPPRASSGSSIP